MRKHKRMVDIETLVKQSDHSIAEISKREDTVEKALSDKYDGVIYWDTPGPRINFKVLWGPSGEERIAKTDGSTNNPRASRHMSRGCDTANEWIKMSAFDEPELYHINPILDYYVTEEDGKEVVITIEKFRKGYVSLDTLLKSSGPLDNRTSEIIFSKYLKAETYLMKKMGLFHRDHKASNMLVRINNTIDFWLIDFTNATKMDTLTEKYMPTVGGHFITDPLLIGKFTNSEKRYSLQSEIFGMGTELYHMLTGNYAFEFDPDKGTAVHLETGENVLDDVGRINFNKYEKLLHKSLHKLKGDKKKWRPFIEKLITLDESKRYSSLDDMASDFYKTMKKKSFKQYLKDHWQLYSAIGLFTLASTGIIAKSFIDNGKLEDDASKYKVYSEWNGIGPTIENNFAQPEIVAYVYDKDSWQSYPKKEFLKVERGKNIDLYVSSNAFPRIKKDKYISAVIPGKAYFEGFEDGKNFEILLTDLESTRTPQDYMYGSHSYSGNMNIDIPKNANDGLINLVVELYAPRSEDKTQGVDDVIFTGEGVIYRQTIPCVVGNDTTVSHIKTARFSYSNYLSLYILDNNNFNSQIDKTIEYDVWIPEEDYKRTFPPEDGNTNAHGLSLNDMPTGTNTDIRTLIVSQRRGSKILSFEALPIQRRAISEEDKIYWWDLAVPDRDWSGKLADYRAEYFNNSKQ